MWLVRPLWIDMSTPMGKSALKLPLHQDSPIADLGRCPFPTNSENKPLDLSATKFLIYKSVSGFPTVSSAQA